MYNPLVVTHPSFYYYSTTNDFPDLPRFAADCNFAPLCLSSHNPGTPSQNAAFNALLQQFEKGILYDKSNVHLPRQKPGVRFTIR